jgi:hypothetical protein
LDKAIILEKEQAGILTAETQTNDESHNESSNSDDNEAIPNVLDLPLGEIDER